MKFSIQICDINGAPVGTAIVCKCPAEAAGLDPNLIGTRVDTQRIPIAGSLTGEKPGVAFFLDIAELQQGRENV